MDLGWVFAYREKRTVTGDYTIRWKNKTFLVKNKPQSIKGEKMEVVRNLKGEIRIWYNKRYLEIEEITEKTVRKLREKRKNNKSKVGKKQKWKPSKDHPWRNQVIGTAGG